MGKKAIDGSDSGFYSQEHTKYVKEQMHLEGFSLEIQVYEMLKRKGWDADLGDYYWDIDRALSPKERINQYENDLNSRTKVYREIDVVAEKTIIPFEVEFFSSAKVKLVVECKARLGENWVVYLENHDITPHSISKYGHGVRNDLSARRYLQSEYPGRYGVSDDARKSLQGTSHHRMEKSLEKGKKGVSLFKNNRSFYTALCQVTDATDFSLVAQQSQTEMDIYSHEKKNLDCIQYWCIYPVLVFDGPLWQVSFTNPVPHPLEWVKFDVMMHNQSYTVDVVRWDFFDKYLEVLAEEIEALEGIS